MTSAALALKPEASRAIRFSDTARGDSRDHAAELERLWAGTGQAEVRVPRVNDATTRGALLATWERVMEDAKSRGWQLAAETMFDDMEDDGYRPTQDDVLRLVRIATDDNMSAPWAITAIRLLGMLVEEDFVPRSGVLEMLRALLSHEDIQRRYYTVKAIWQARDEAALPSLKRLLKQEKSGDVRRILKRAIAVLE